MPLSHYGSGASAVRKQKPPGKKMPRLGVAGQRVVPLLDTWRR